MYELALRHAEGPVTLREIADRQGMSEKYLSKLIIPLKSAKLVASSRGSHGGYVLSREPHDITLRQMVEALEGDLSPVECVTGSSACERTASCPLQSIWKGLEKSMLSYLESVSLADIVADGERAGRDSVTFCI